MDPDVREKDLHIVMSYPNLLPGSDAKRNYVTFSVPNYKVVRKIVDDSEEEEDLRKKVSGRSLEKNLTEIATLFKNYEIESAPIAGHQELQVRLFVPNRPPPRPPTKSQHPDRVTARYVVLEPSSPKNSVHCRDIGRQTDMKKRNMIKRFSRSENLFTIEEEES